MAWIETINEDEASGPIGDIYAGILKESGSDVVPNIYKIQSLNPEALTAHKAMYKTLVFGRSPLRRYQREMIATWVSTLNECHY